MASMPAKIDSFSGDYKFLSNFYEHPVTLSGIAYRCAEGAFQAQKDPSRAEQFKDLSGKDAKHLGRQVHLNEHWDQIRLCVMDDVLHAKFEDPELRQKLLDTGDAELIEGNTWGDRYWGVCDGTGENNLGRLLMELRKELRDASRLS